MSVNVDFHFRSDDDNPVSVSTGTGKTSFGPFAQMTVGQSTGKVAMYFHNLDDIERIAFQLDVLIRDIRDGELFQ